MASQTAPPSFASFFDLPPEIRTQILREICLTTEPVATTERSTFRPPSNLFLAHSALYAAAAELYYGENTFSVELSPSVERILLAHRAEQGHDMAGMPRLKRRHRRREPGQPGSDDSDCSEDWTRGPRRPFSGARHLLLSREALRVRRIVLLPRRLDPVVSKVVCPALERLILDGSLRVLAVRLATSHADGVVERHEQDLQARLRHTQQLHPPTEANSSHDDAYDPDRDSDRGENDPARGLPALPARVPFQALLHLMADPYLHEVRLVTSIVHRSVWCRFHDENKQPIERHDFVDAHLTYCAVSGPPRPKGDGAAANRRTIELDWRAIALRYGSADVRGLLKSKTMAK